MGEQPVKQWQIGVNAPIGPQLYRILRERIIRSDLPPGSRMSEAEIARAYDISRQPAREVLIKLSEEGLVEIRPQRGTLVTKISISAVMDSRFVREAIEADIVKVVAEKADAALETELRRQIERQMELPDRQPDKFLELDELFHRTLAEAAGKTYAWKVVEEVKAHMDRVRYLSTREFPTKRLVKQHIAIVDAIVARDPQAASEAMRTHLRAIMQDLPAIAAAHPELFDKVEEEALSL